MEPRIGFTREMARKVLKKYGVKAPPVDVERIITGEAVVLRAVDYPDDTAGESWWEDGVAFIEYSSGLGNNRRRFTLAHELGHVLLRHYQMRNRDTSALDGPLREAEGEEWEPKDPYEIEANQFAAELLMPNALFKKEWQSDPNGRRVPALARRYGVSEQAAWWQIRGFPVR